MKLFVRRGEATKQSAGRIRRVWRVAVGLIERCLAPFALTRHPRARLVFATFCVACLLVMISVGVPAIVRQTQRSVELREANDVYGYADMLGNYIALLSGIAANTGPKPSHAERAHLARVKAQKRDTFRQATIAKSTAHRDGEIKAAAPGADVTVSLIPPKNEPYVTPPRPSPVSASN
jgi:hypothetical protein